MSRNRRQDYDDEPWRESRRDHDRGGDGRHVRRTRDEDMEYEFYREGDSRRERRTNGILIAVIVLLVGGMLFAGWKLASIFINYQRDRAAYTDLADHAVATPAAPRAPAQSAPEEPEEEPFVSEIPIEVDWDYLRSVNKDIVGWLYCPDTVINYPVYQRDNSFYLKHGADGASNTAGALFADISSELPQPHGNYIIYGHNMKDGSMFGTLDDYIDEAYYKEHPVMYYLTPDDGAYRVEFICASIAESTIVNFPTYFESTAAYREYLNDITSHSFWVNSAAVTTDYEMITLVTCAYTNGYRDPRYLVHGIMVPIE